MNAAIRRMAGLDMPIIPVNDHPIRHDYMFAKCITIAEMLGGMMVEISPDEQGMVWQAMIDAHKEKLDEIERRLAVHQRFIRENKNVDIAELERILKGENSEAN